MIDIKNTKIQDTFGSFNEFTHPLTTSLNNRILYIYIRR